MCLYLKKNEMVVHITFSFLLLLLGKAAAQQNWAVLVAGSSGYENYRHQSDVCHAYQIISSHGVPESNTIVMMYNDIANNPNNPVQGNIINSPTGPNVYQGVNIDYQQEDCTANNFLNVLTGGRAGNNGTFSGKMLQSGPNDNVFVYFADHGNTGIIAMPDQIISSTQLQQALQTMSEHQMFGNLVFYMEACESGSMFSEMQIPPNVYAVTAANPSQSSYGDYCGSSDDAGRGTCLGDLFSTNWMEYVDKNGVSNTLEQQYQVVSQETAYKSQVCQYGQLGMTSDILSQFLGASGNGTSMDESGFAGSRSAVHIDDITELTLQRKLQRATGKDDMYKVAQEIQSLHKNRANVDTMMKAISDALVPGNFEQMMSKPRSLGASKPCYEDSVGYFHSSCLDVAKNPYALRQVHMLANICKAGISQDRIADAIDQECNMQGTVGIK